MRAVAVGAFGEAPRLMELPTPSPGEDEVRVRISAAGMNPFDGKIADGILRGRPHLFPLVLGVDGAGVVEEVGSAVRRFRKGEPIFGSFLHDPVGTGTYAEQTLVPEANGVLRRPDRLSPIAAAAMPTAGMTAVDALDRLGLERGEGLIVVGASGGVGSYAIPLARHRGVRVFAAARPESFERLRALGAEETWDVGRADWPDAFRRAHPRGTDALLDLMDREPEFAHALGLVRDGGRAASTVYAAGAARPQRDVRAFDIDMKPSRELLERLVSETVGSDLSPPVLRTISLAAAPAALAEIRSGRARGKTVIRLEEPLRDG